MTVDYDKIRLNVAGKEITVGAVLESNGSTSNLKTGGWRALKPVTDHEKCTACHMCWVYCPDISRIIDDDGKYDTDFDYCKGCGICAQICPVKCIKMVPEEK